MSRQGSNGISADSRITLSAFNHTFGNSVAPFGNSIRPPAFQSPLRQFNQTIGQNNPRRKPELCPALRLKVRVLHGNFSSSFSSPSSPSPAPSLEFRSP